MAMSSLCSFCDPPCMCYAILQHATWSHSHWHIFRLSHDTTTATDQITEVAAWGVLRMRSALTLWQGRQQWLVGWQDRPRTESCGECRRGVTLQSGQCRSPSSTDSCWPSPLPHLPENLALRNTYTHTVFSFIYRFIPDFSGNTFNGLIRQINWNFYILDGRLMQLLVILNYFKPLEEETVHTS